MDFTERKGGGSFFCFSRIWRRWSRVWMGPFLGCSCCGKCELGVNLKGMVVGFRD